MSQTSITTFTHSTRDNIPDTNGASKTQTRWGVVTTLALVTLTALTASGLSAAKLGGFLKLSQLPNKLAWGVLGGGLTTAVAATALGISFRSSTIYTDKISKEVLTLGGKEIMPVITDRDRELASVKEQLKEGEFQVLNHNSEFVLLVKTKDGGISESRLTKNTSENETTYTATADITNLNLANREPEKPPRVAVNVVQEGLLNILSPQGQKYFVGKIGDTAFVLKTANEETHFESQDELDAEVADLKYARTITGDPQTLALPLVNCNEALRLQKEQIDSGDLKDGAWSVRVNADGKFILCYGNTRNVFESKEEAQKKVQELFNAETIVPSKQQEYKLRGLPETIVNMSTTDANRAIESDEGSSNMYYVYQSNDDNNYVYRHGGMEVKFDASDKSKLAQYVDCEIAKGNIDTMCRVLVHKGNTHDIGEQVSTDAVNNFTFGPDANKHAFTIAPTGDNEFTVKVADGYTKTFNTLESADMAVQRHLQRDYSKDNFVKYKEPAPTQVKA